MINNLSDKRIRCVCLHLSIFTLFFKKKKKQEGNKSTHYASISRKKSGRQFIIFLSSIACLSRNSRLSKQFSLFRSVHSMKRFETRLRSYVEITLPPPGCLFLSVHRSNRNVASRGNKDDPSGISSMVGRFSRISRYVFARLFATRNRMFISRSKNETPAGFVANPPVCQAWNRIETFCEN